MINLYPSIITILHFSLMTIVSYIILFSKDINVLIILNIILFIILTMNYILDECPITLIEDKYHNNPTMDLIFHNTINLYKNKYNKNLRSVLTLEIIWIALLLSIEKLLIILFFRNFNLKNI